MIADKIKELTTTKSKVAELEAAIAAELNTELAALPTRYGFENVEAFVTAVRAASGKRRGRKPSVAKSASAKTAPKERKRAKITDEVRAEVKKLAEAGKTGSEIAKAVGISLPSVQNVKKQLGLVRRKK